MATASPSRWPSFGVQVLIGMVTGLALGLIAREGQAAWLTGALATTGSVFVQLLKAIVPPLVFTAIVASIANLGELTNAARLAWKTLLWFAITAGIAVVIGLALGLLIQPGHHSAVAASAAAAPAGTGGWTDFLKGLVPGNFLGLTATTTIGDDGRATSTIGINVLQLLVISIAVKTSGGTIAFRS